MIYLSGDIHGDVGRVENAVQKYGITVQDTIILLGDVGLNFYGDSRDTARKDFLNALGILIFCIHGNHEMRPESIPSYHEAKWHGGTVFVEDKYPNLLFAKDGELFDLEGYTALVIGGAYSVDKNYRLKNNLPWFADEQPSEVTRRRVEEKLNNHAWLVDIVLSHTCPERYIPQEAFLPNIESKDVDNSTEAWLGRIERKLCYGYWFCGHWHIDKRIDKMHFLMYSYETLPVLETYVFEIAKQVLDDILEWCEKSGTTLDLVTRAFLRFCIEPENRGIVEKWVQEWRNNDSLT